MPRTELKTKKRTLPKSKAKKSTVKKSPIKSNTKTVKKQNGNGAKMDDFSVFRALASAITSRSNLFGAFDQQFGGDRSIYQACGYPQNILFEEMWNRYKRGDIAKRIVNAFPDETWLGKPEVIDNEDPEETEFEKAWKTLVKDNKVYHYLKRVDRLSGIGRYGVLLLGFDGADPMEQPIAGKRKLLYLQPYKEDHVTIKKWDEDPKSERYGLPEIYEIDTGSVMKDEDKGTTGTVQTDKLKLVHYSRIIHIAEDCSESDVYGTPRLEVMWNRLMDLDKIMGGSGEMFWRGGFPGLALEMDSEANPDTQTITELDEEIEKYIHRLTRVLRLQGIEAKELTGDAKDPEGHVNVQLRIISAVTGIPVRILTGSERGELASTTDQRNWNKKVDERRKDYAEPMILREFINRMIEYGVLPKPQDGEYEVRWPDLDTMTEKESAEVDETRAKTLEHLAKANSIGGDMIVPVEHQRTDFLGYEQEEADQINEDVDEQLELEAKETAEAEESMRKAEEARKREEEDKKPVTEDEEFV